MQLRYYDAIRDEMRYKRRYIWAVSGFFGGLILGMLLKTLF